MTKRPYKVVHEHEPTRLILADTPARVGRYLIRNSYRITPATALEVATLITREGIKPEDAHLDDLPDAPL